MGAEVGREEGVNAGGLEEGAVVFEQGVEDLDVVGSAGEYASTAMVVLPNVRLQSSSTKGLQTWYFSDRNRVGDCIKTPVFGFRSVISARTDRMSSLASIRNEVDFMPSGPQICSCI